MKRIKLRLRKLRKREEPETEGSASGRITNETVAEYREQILAGGRKFKYPMQSSKHHIVLNSVIIVFIATVLLVSLCWWQLYPAQNTSKFMYRISQILPFPVAQVEGNYVRYSDYLLELRSAIHYLSTKETVNFSSDDGKRQLEYQKRLALNKAIENAYAAKLAKENGIQVTDKEVDEFVTGQIKDNRLGVTEDVYRQVIEDYYDWSFGEYKQSVHNQLLHKKVVARVDTESLKKINNVLAQVKAGGDFAKLTTEHSDDLLSKSSGGDLGFVPKNSDDPSGLLKEAAKLKAGEISDVIIGIDGYYVVKVIEQRESDIHIAKLFVSYKEFDKRVAKLKTDKTIKEFIKVAEAAQPSSRQ